MWSPVPGHRHSSLRAELSAGIVAAASPQAVHFATDSMSFLKVAGKIIANQNLTRKRPWALQANGDLWQVFEYMVQQRGHSSIKGKWTKGHAKPQHIADGSSTIADREGNEKADGLADKGVAEHVLGLSLLSEYYAAKHAKVISLAARIHRMMLRTLREEKMLREEADKRQEAERRLSQGTKLPSVLVPNCPNAPNFGTGVCIEISPIMPQHFVHAYDWHNAATVRHFMAITQWASSETESDHLGASWIELLALYYAMGGTLRIKGHGYGDFDTRPSLAKELQTFSSVCRNIAQFNCDLANQLLFQPSRATGHRLAHYGISRRIPCIRGEACISTQLASRQTKAVLGVRSTLNTKELAAFEAGTLRRVCGRPNLRQVAPWPECEGPLTQATQRAEDRAAELAQQQQQAPTVPEAALPSVPLQLSCPACRQVRLVKTALLEGHKWKALSCPSCKKTQKASIWQCRCETKWHKCPIHRQIGLALAKCPKPNPRGSQVRGRRVPPPILRFGTSANHLNSLGRNSNMTMGAKEVLPITLHPNPPASAELPQSPDPHPNPGTACKRQRLGPPHNASSTQPRCQKTDVDGINASSAQPSCEKRKHVAVESLMLNAVKSQRLRQYACSGMVSLISGTKRAMDTSSSPLLTSKRRCRVLGDIEPSSSKRRGSNCSVSDKPAKRQAFSKAGIPPPSLPRPPEDRDQ